MMTDQNFLKDIVKATASGKKPTKEELEWFGMFLPSTPLLRCDLSKNKNIMDYLWGIIDEAKEGDINFNSSLAGNISKSLSLIDRDGYFFDTVLHGVCTEYIKQNIRYHFDLDIGLREFWVNFSKKHEFNPLHDHAGLLSFVIWMDIPTKSEDQHNLPISKHSGVPAASDFQLVYNDVNGSIRTHSIDMDPSMNGTIILFPSNMAHQVYPFYECEDERVSISGNIFGKTSPWDSLKYDTGS